MISMFLGDTDERGGEQTYFPEELNDDDSVLDN